MDERSIVLGEKHMLYLLTNFVLAEFGNRTSERNTMMQFVEMQWGRLLNESSADIQKRLGPWINSPDRRTSTEKDLLKNFKIVQDDN